MSSNSETSLLKLLNRIAEEQKYENYGIKVSPLSTGGANYSSLLYTAKITSPNKKDLLLFIKELAISKKLQEEFGTSVVEREKAFYTDFVNLYKDIEKKYHVPEEHCLTQPKYFGMELGTSSDFLVLENIAARGYVSFDRFQSMDWEYASKAVTELAKLQALSVALQINHPKEFERLKEKYLENLFTRELLDNLWQPGTQHALSVLDGGVKIKFQKFIDNTDIYSAFVDIRKPSKMNVIVHGDFRPSNFMHKYFENGTLQLMVLDHQTLTMGNPVNDLLYLIGLATDKPFRDQYHDKLIEFYYTQLSEALKRLDIDPNATYSREDYYADLKKNLRLALIFATFALHFITVEADKAPELTPNMTMDNFNVKELGPLYADRMRDLVNDCVKWGILTD